MVSPTNTILSLSARSNAACICSPKPSARARYLARHPSAAGYADFADFRLYRVAVDGSGAEPLVTTSTDKFASSVSPDGRTLLFNASGNRDVLHKIQLDGSTAQPVNATSLGQRNAVFAPNGEWMAYEETGVGEVTQVFVQAVAGASGRQQVSAGGGDQPRWTKGGREIVYRNADAVLAVSFDPGTQTIGTPVELFRIRTAGRLGSGRTLGYDVSPDGMRFLMVVPVARPDAQPNVVVLNWLDELRERVPRARQ